MRFRLRRRRARTDSDRCPQCGGRGAVPIVYGFPGPMLFEAERRGEADLGGCVIMPTSPDHHCTSCGRNWQQRSASGT